LRHHASRSLTEPLAPHILAHTHTHIQIHTNTHTHTHKCTHEYTHTHCRCHETAHSIWRCTRSLSPSWYPPMSWCKHQQLADGGHQMEAQTGKQADAAHLAGQKPALGGFWSRQPSVWLPQCLECCCTCNGTVRCTGRGTSSREVMAGHSEGIRTAGQRSPGHVSTPGQPQPPLVVVAPWCNHAHWMTPSCSDLVTIEEMVTRLTCMPSFKEALKFKACIYGSRAVQHDRSQGMMTIAITASNGTS
jgi:hypothetical protein